MYDGKCIRDRLNVSCNLLSEAICECSEIKNTNHRLRQVLADLRSTADIANLTSTNQAPGIPIPAHPNNRQDSKPQPVGWDLELDIDLT